MPKRRVLTIKGRYLIDTNVLIYATLSGDPRADRAQRVIERGGEPDCEALISVQNLAEMYPNLTGPKSQPPDTATEACEKIRRIAALAYVQVLPVTTAVVHKALELVEHHGVTGQKYFDMQLAATLLVYEIPTLVTENNEDFAAFSDFRVINPFA